jgi:pyruvate,water dikinase
VARALDPRPAVHRLRGAWRVGRLRAALPHLAEHLLERTDTDLRRIPALEELSSRQLVALLHRSREVLRALHAHEVLMGLLTDAGSTLTGASVALRVLANAREEGLTDAEIVERYPVVLAVTAPRVGPRPALAPSLEATLLTDHPDGEDVHANEAGVLREALRLRVRWVQELGGRAAWELGRRLAADGLVTHAERVRHLRLDDLDAVATHRGELVPALVAIHEDHPGPALPARFRLSDTGRPIRVRVAEAGGGTGAGGGVGRGVVTHDAADPPPGSVLVTTTLTPGLGPILPRLEGIVAETGSVLSHLAILAREAGVATVVGYPAATEELSAGSVVVVDGHSGQVTIEPSELRA